MRGRTRLIVAVLLATLVAGGSIATALAHKPRIPSRISINAFFDHSQGEYVYHGRVRSERAGCVRHRTVQLKNEQVGTIETDTTDAEGRWEVRLGQDTLSGDYWAKVTRKVKSTVICKSDLSRRIGPPSP